jgi:hypothetical protein
MLSDLIDVGTSDSDNPMGSAGLWMGLLSMSIGFLIVFYFIYRGRHLNRLGKSLIYYDLSFKAVAKTASVNVFYRHGQVFRSSGIYISSVFFQCPIARVIWSVVAKCFGASNIPSNL